MTAGSRCVVATGEFASPLFFVSHFHFSHFSFPPPSVFSSHSQGTVESTGQRGMLPSNYIEAAEGDAAPAAEAPAEEPPAPAPAAAEETAAEEEWKAVYDYEATDTDEVSFKEGDIIVNVEVIDDGWVKVRGFNFGADLNC